MAFRQFVRCARKALLHVLFGVAATPESILELFHRRSDDENDHGRGIVREDLLGALDLDLEQHVTITGRGRGVP